MTFDNTQIKSSFLNGKTKVWIAISIALILGVALGSLIQWNMFATRPSGADSKNQSIAIAGVETVKVLSPEGRVLSVWTGADPIYPDVANAIVTCATGNSTTPPGFGSCSEWINGILIRWDNTTSGICTYNTDFVTHNCSALTIGATNTLTPQGCNPAAAFYSPDLCTGWITEATFGPNTFTTTNCGSSCNVEAVQGFVLGGTSFDCIGTSTYAGPYCGSLSSIANVSPGDSLLVTIQFTVS